MWQWYIHVCTVHTCSFTREHHDGEEAEPSAHVALSSLSSETSLLIPNEHVCTGAGGWTREADPGGGRGRLDLRFLLLPLLFICYPFVRASKFRCLFSCTEADFGTPLLFFESYLFL